ncbi:MAG: hypothetical protein ACYTGZ_12580 [Planctomycetota bacterium]
MRNMTLSLALASLLVGFAAQPAVAGGWKKLDGQKMPPISAKAWLNAGKKGPDLSALRGKVVLLEFFATW